TTYSRTVAPPMYEGTLGETPFFSSAARDSARGVPVMSYFTSPRCSVRRRFFSSLGGAIESPSPRTSRGTPRRGSPWRRPPAGAEDHQRDARAHLARRAPVGEQRLHRQGQHVEEAGRDGEAARVQARPRLSVLQVADGRDAVAAQAHVRAPTRRARAVVDGAA